MADLIAVTRAEIAKLTRRPATWVLLAAAIALNQAFGFLIPYISYRTGSSGEMTNGASPTALLASTLPDQVIVNTTAAYPVFTGALALVLGALVTGGEHATGTLKTLLTQGPGRITVFLGQLVAAVIVVGAGVLVMFATSAASSALIAAIEDAPSRLAGPGRPAHRAGSRLGGDGDVGEPRGDAGGAAAVDGPTDRSRRGVDPRGREPRLRRRRHHPVGTPAAARRAARGQRRLPDQRRPPRPPPAPSLQASRTPSAAPAGCSPSWPISSLSTALLILGTRRRDVT